MITDKQKEIIILTTAPFPVGLAATNRIIAYCKGFFYHGYHPAVICIRPTENYSRVINNQSSGIYYGIKYSYPAGRTVRVKSFLGRRLNDIISVISTIILYIHLLQKREVSFCIFYGNSVLSEIVFILISRLFGIKIYKEESENPNVYFSEKKPFYNMVIKWFVLNRLYRYYNGVLVMTQKLHDFFLDKGIRDCKILVVPQTVDIERFENADEEIKSHTDGDYIAYLGSLNQNKDGVLTLIKTFKIINENFPDLKLFIAGDGTLQEKSAVLTLIASLELSDKIKLSGRISSDEVPLFLKRAKVLVSCRPSSLQSDFGFPTKIVEYLASGKPTITTATGELGFYLEDRVTAFVVSDSSKEAFASEIIEVLDNYKFAMDVARNGKNQARVSFNPIIQTRKIIDFSINDVGE